MEMKRKFRIKDWEVMEKEYDVSSGGTILCRFGFTQAMKYLCGRVFELPVREYHVSKSVIGYIDDYAISKDMVDEITVEEFEIKITFDGNKGTIANTKGYGITKASLCPEDSFDYKEGTRIAVLRAFGFAEKDIFKDVLRDSSNKEIIEELKNRI